MTKRHNYKMSCTKTKGCECAKCCLCFECLLNRRSVSLYGGMRSRFGAKKYKHGEKAGQIRKEKQDIPFNLEQFRAWLRVVIEDTPFCEYCQAPISIKTLSPDHAMPISRGGGLGLANLRGCCQPCQSIKGNLTVAEFKSLMRGLSSFPEPARVDIMRRLKSGSMGIRLRHFTKEEGGKPADVMAVPAVLVKSKDSDF